MNREEYYNILVSNSHRFGRYICTFNNPPDSSNLGDLEISLDDREYVVMLTDYIIQEDLQLRINLEKCLQRKDGSKSCKRLIVNTDILNQFTIIGTYLFVNPDIFLQLTNAPLFRVEES